MKTQFNLHDIFIFPLYTSILKAVNRTETVLFDNDISEIAVEKREPSHEFLESLEAQLTFVIPAFNEFERIQSVLLELASFISRHSLNWTIIVSIDGEDDTLDLTNAFSEIFEFIKVSSSTVRRGKGHAIRRVLSQIDSEYTVLMDADRSISLREIIRNVHHALEHDAVIFSRYSHEKSEIPFSRRLLSRVFNLLVRKVIGLDIRDTQSGYKIFRTKLLKKAMSMVTVTDPFYDVAMLFHLRKLGCDVIEIPVKYIHSNGSSFRLLGLVLGMTISLFAFRIRYSRIYDYVPVTLRELYYSKFTWI